MLFLLFYPQRSEIIWWNLLIDCRGSNLERLSALSYSDPEGLAGNNCSLPALYHQPPRLGRHARHEEDFKF
jgi:hypothetical protein